MAKCTWYWHKGKWIMGHCLYINELRNMGYLAIKGDSMKKPPPPKPEELKDKQK